MNEPQGEITPEQKLLIQKYLGGLIKEWLAWIGAANLLFIVGALSYVLFVLPGKAANEANKAMENNIKFYVDTIQGKLPEVFQQSGRLDERLAQVEQATKEVQDKNEEFKVLFENASSNLKEIKANPAYQAAEAIKALNESSDAKTILSKLNSSDERISQLEKINQQYASELDALRNFKSKLSVGARLVYRGDGNPSGWHSVGCADPNIYLNGECAGGNISQKMISSKSGGQCGHTYIIATCLIK